MQLGLSTTTTICLFGKKTVTNIQSLSRFETAHTVDLNYCIVYHEAYSQLGPINARLLVSFVGVVQYCIILLLVVPGSL